MDTLAMLEELLEQNQFELLIPKDGMSGELRLVYLMNDAVESFLVFKNARMTGAYLEDYEGELTYSISKDGRGYALVVWQGEHAVTILFEMLELEVHLYDYGEIAHFWSQSMNIYGSWNIGSQFSEINMNISDQNTAHRRNRSWHIWHIFHR